VSELAELLSAAEVDPAPPERADAGDGAVPPPRWNVAPQAAVWALSVGKRRLTGGGGGAGSGDTSHVRRLAQYRWGLVPSWAKDPAVGARMFNARGGTLAAKPAYRTALARRRCIIPADAFYEWGPASDEAAVVPAGLPGIDTGTAPKAGGGRKTRPRKQPWCFRRADGEILAFAGLWEAWKPPNAGDGQPSTQAPHHPGWLLSCTIITTEANELVAGVHDRMPVILPTDAWDEWLGPNDLAPADLQDLLAPAPSGVLISYKVADLVSNSRSEGKELAEPLSVTVASAGC